VSLNNKKKEACQLARERRRRSAVTRLLEMREISQRCAKLVRAAGPPVDHGELLYDEQGLPR